jgi:hypothetical protein
MSGLGIYFTLNKSRMKIAEEMCLIYGNPYSKVNKERKVSFYILATS